MYDYHGKCVQNITGKNYFNDVCTEYFNINIEAGNLNTDIKISFLTFVKMFN